MTSIILTLDRNLIFYNLKLRFFIKYNVDKENKIIL